MCNTYTRVDLPRAFNSRYGGTALAASRAATANGSRQLKVASSSASLSSAQANENRRNLVRSVVTVVNR
jgi:hypothetical protein